MHYKYIGYLDTENDESGKVTLVTLILNKIRFTSEGMLKQQWRYIWKCKRTALRFLEGLPRTLIYTHNLEYDLINLFGDYYAWLNHTYLQSKLVLSQWGRITFYDSFLHYSMSAKEIGEAVGLPKLKMDIHDQKYAMRDCEIIESAMSLLHEKVWQLCGQFVGATSGSTAVKVWRAITKDEFIQGAYEPCLSRDAYYGGRVEIFRREFGKAEAKAFNCVSGYDVNSMYPFVMRFAYPLRLVEDIHMDKEFGLIDADFEISNDSFVGMLPVRFKSRLIYPVGKFRTIVTYHEARQRGIKINKIYRSFGTNCYCYPFKQFVDTLYKLRMEAPNKAERLVWKIILNSLYGKMVSRNEILKTMTESKLAAHIEKWKNRAETFFTPLDKGVYLVKRQTPPQGFENVVWGAYITSYARIHLNNILRNNEKRIMYCDTDSCYLMGQTLKGCKIGKNLGEVKLEKATKSAIFIAPKCYRFGTDYTAKGIPAPWKDDGKRDMQYRKEFIDHGKTTFKLPVKFRSAQKHNLAKNPQKAGHIRPNLWQTVTKTAKTIYFKKMKGNEFVPPVLPRDSTYLEKGVSNEENLFQWAGLS